MVPADGAHRDDDDTATPQDRDGSPVAMVPRPEWNEMA